MKGKALRKHSLHEKTAASVLLKLVISSNEWCHTTDAPLAHKRNSIFKCKQQTCTLRDPWGPEKYDYTTTSFAYRRHLSAECNRICMHWAYAPWSVLANQHECSNASLIHTVDVLWSISPASTLCINNSFYYITLSLESFPICELRNWQQYKFWYYVHALYFNSLLLKVSAKSHIMNNNLFSYWQ